MGLPPEHSERLDSWKEIAVYLKREVRTVRIWEKQEGLPVRRHLHRLRGSVYAFRSELDSWWSQRSPERSPRSRRNDYPSPAQSRGFKYTSTNSASGDPGSGRGMGEHG